MFSLILRPHCLCKTLWPAGLSDKYITWNLQVCRIHNFWCKNNILRVIYRYVNNLLPCQIFTLISTCSSHAKCKYLLPCITQTVSSLYCEGDIGFSYLIRWLFYVASTLVMQYHRLLRCVWNCLKCMESHTT